MIDRHSVIVFFHKAKWTESAITHEINCMLGENIISYSTLGKYVRVFGLFTKESGRLTGLLYIPEENHSKIYASTWTMHMRIMQGDQLNVFTQKTIQRIPHPASGPDFAPSDSFLFGYIKRKLTEYDIPDRQSLKSAITHIFDEIGQETLILVFET
jgi:hypothetical protein